MNSERYLQMLRPYIQHESLFIRRNPYDDTQIDIFVNGQKESVAFFGCNEDGELQTFSQYDDEVGNRGEYLKEQAIQLTTQFISDFFSPLAGELYCSIAIGFDEFYVIEYARKDALYNLELPNSGITFHIDKSGKLTHMANEFERIELIYPKQILAPAKAKQVLMHGVVPTLELVRFDEEDYIDGDDCYKLVYNFIDYVPYDVKMDSTVTMLQQFGQVQQTYATIPQEISPFGETPTPFRTDIPCFIEVEAEEGIIQAWKIDADAESVTTEELTSIDWETEGFAKRLLDSNTNTVKKYMYAPMMTEQQINENEAYEQAIRYLQSALPTRWTSFRWHQEDVQLHMYDDEGENPKVYAYHFEFHLFIQGIQVSKQSVTIVIGATDGELLQYEVTDGLLDYYEVKLPVVYTVEQARMKYEAAFSMQLHWAKSVDEQSNSSYYELVYVQAFEGTGGHIHFVEANTLNAWVVDVGDSIECLNTIQSDSNLT